IRNNEPNISEIRLYEAAPDGKNWNLHGSIIPGSPGFPFKADEDRAYYFKVAVVDKATKKQVPEDINRDGEIKCIVVDTVKPKLQVRSIERQGDEVTVRWDLIEQNPDFATFKLEYRDSDAPTTQWSDVPVSTPQAAEAKFTVSGPAVAVRLS